MTIEIRIRPTKELMFNKEGSYGIYGAEVNPEDLMTQEVELNNYNNISIKGTMPQLGLGEEYIVTVEKDAKTTYKGTYIVKGLKQEKPTSVEDQKHFFSMILTETQLKNVFDVYEGQDIIEMIQNDTFDYSKVHGIGKTSYERMKDKVIQSLEMSDLLVFLGKHDIKYNMISPLVKEYGNAQIVIDKITNNPYVLTEVRGVGFKKADAIAKAMKYDMKSPNRIEACIHYCLDDESKNGHTWTDRKKLLDKVIGYLGIEKKLIIDVLDSQMKNIVNEDGKHSEKYIYESEEYIAMRISQLNTHNKKVFETEELEKLLSEYCAVNNVELEENQRQFFHDWNENSVVALVGGGGCVDKDTEFFNGTEWKKISDYKDGDRVLTYNNDGTASLTFPSKYIKLKEDKLTFFKNETGSINQCLSDEHNFVYKTSRNNIALKEFSKVKEMHEKSKLGFSGKIVTTFNYDGIGIQLSDDEIRLMVAVIADGNFVNKYGNKCRINIKKPRKKIRLEELFKKTNTEYVKREAKDGYSIYVFNAPLREKVYRGDWYNCNNHQLSIIADEVILWDGSKTEGRAGQFWTNEKESADFIQFALSSVGTRATTSIRNRDNGDVEYYVTLSKNNGVSMKTNSDVKLKFEEYKTLDGYKYCFTVNSGMWVMRRNGRIAVTGNCGKSWLLQILLEIVSHKHLSTALLAPTGRASKVMANYTGRGASTIHRRIAGAKGIYEDLVVIDESSMCDVPILASLFEAVKNPNARVLFIGDDFQLPSVGVGNFLFDILHSTSVKISRLKKVFRQADGGILEIATSIREGRQFLNATDEGRIVYGRDCVFWMVDQEYVLDGILSNYKNVIKRFDMEDVAILTPTNKGNLGTIALNKRLQEIANPASPNKAEFKAGKKEDPTIYRVGDLVMNTVNAYGVSTLEGGEADVFNGDVGKIIDIDDEKKIVIINFDGINVIINKGEMLGTIVHAWAMTIHKSQGSQFKVVILVVDKSMSYQLNANILYTGLSRAQEYEMLIGQPITIIRAMTKFINMKRRSFLQEMLERFSGNTFEEITSVLNDKYAKKTQNNVSPSIDKSKE